LEQLVKQALQVAKKARAHRRSLDALNYYADRLAKLRTDATIAFQEASDPSVGDVSVMAEMVSTVFSPHTDYRMRAELARELLHELRTKKWRTSAGFAQGPGLQDEFFPLSLLAKTRRGYLVTVGREMNGCYASGWYDACLVMMRRLLETCIIEAYEGCGIAAEIKDPQGDFLQLSQLIQKAVAETRWNLSRNTRSALPILRNVGHMSAHSRRFTAQRSDIDRLREGCRVVVEEFLHLARLLDGR